MSVTVKPQTFTHPLLGALTGRISLSTPNVVHFRSIPFATIPARFRQSILLDHVPSSHSRDFTHYGTGCPSLSETNQIEAAGGLLPGEKEKEFDEFDCLNLTISVPKDALGDEGKKLPVMVYVHGGGFTVGSAHISALHETTPLVELSIKEGTPVIIVSIHYRLHFLGFLACQDLLLEAASLGEPAGNFGILDQRTAFIWIKRQISGFGGDPKRITAFGESAGSASIAIHMCSSVPLFNRAILMSGTATALPILDLKYKEAEYLALLQYLGIDENDPERLKKLRDVPVEKIVGGIRGSGMLFFNPYGDREFFPRGIPTHFNEEEVIGSCEWVNEIIIGDSFSEGWLLSPLLKNVDIDKFIVSSDYILGRSNALKILSAYNIAPKMDANLFWTKLNFLMGDVMFSQPIHKLSRALASQNEANKKKIYRYTQTVRNPFPGGLLHQIPAHHFIETMFLFGTLRHRYPTQRLRELSDEYGRRWIKFTYGLGPWEEYAEDEKIVVIEGRAGFDLRSRREDEEKSGLAEEGERRYKGWEAIWEVMNDIAGGVEGSIKGEEARIRWGTDGGIFRLAGFDGPFGIVLP